MIVCDLVSATKPFVWFSWNSVLEYFKKWVVEQHAFYENRLYDRRTSLKGVN